MGRSHSPSLSYISPPGSGYPQNNLSGRPPRSFRKLIVVVIHSSYQFGWARPAQGCERASSPPPEASATQGRQCGDFLRYNIVVERWRNKCATSPRRQQSVITMLLKGRDRLDVLQHLSHVASWGQTTNTPTCNPSATQRQRNKWRFAYKFARLVLREPYTGNGVQSVVIAYATCASFTTTYYTYL